MLTLIAKSMQASWNDRVKWLVKNPRTHVPAYIIIWNIIDLVEGLALVTDNEIKQTRLRKEPIV
jgi:hypothetical protein